MPAQNFPRVVPTPQELVGLPAAVISDEIAKIEAVISNRYEPNDTFAELCDELGIQGRLEKRAYWVDLIRYRGNLYMAQRIQAIEGPTGGIGMLDVRTNDANCRPGGGWGYYC